MLGSSSFYGGSTTPASPAKKRRVIIDTEDEPMLAPSAGHLASPSRRSLQASTSKSSPSRRPPASPSASRRKPTGTKGSPASTTPTKLKVVFNDRVYRPFEDTTPAEVRAMYTTKGDFLGEPDERVGDEQALIRCPCAKATNESLMIQCDECNAWQHCRCVGFESEEDCPDQYDCWLCVKAQKQKRERACTPPPSRERMVTPEPSIRPQIPPPSSPTGRLSDSDDDGLQIENTSPHASLLSSPSIRGGSYSSPRKSGVTGSPSTYAASRALLMQMGTSPVNRPTASHPLLTPTKSAKKRTTANSELTAGSLDPNEVPLPDHYAALLSLHTAVERAIMLHLATEGSKACGVASSSPSQSSTSDLHIQLPNIVTYSAMRAVVERGSNKRFGPTELGQLIWLWEGGLAGVRSIEDEEAADGSEAGQKKRGGLSISVAATKELDKSTGRRVWTWGFGIELQVKQNVQLPAFEIVETTPTSSPQSNADITGRSPAGRNVPRTGMSVMPLWSSKAEFRKEEMRRRLGQCVIKAHNDFNAIGAKSLSASRMATSTSKRVSFHGDGCLPTPPPTNHKRSQAGSPLTAAPSVTSPFTRGFILDALPPIPSATLPLLGPAKSTPVKAAGSGSTHTIATVDAEVARQETTSEKRRVLEEGNVVEEVKAPAAQRAMSLLERIKAKEAALLAEPQHGSEKTLFRSGSGKGKKEAAKASLEMASLRAKKRDISKKL